MDPTKKGYLYRKVKSQELVHKFMARKLLVMVSTVIKVMIMIKSTT